jgi:hypothetical protein
MGKTRVYGELKGKCRKDWSSKSSNWLQPLRQEQETEEGGLDNSTGNNSYKVTIYCNLIKFLNSQSKELFIWATFVHQYVWTLKNSGELLE